MTDSPLTHPPRAGVLLAQLGTPDAPDTRAVRRYLREFLSDRRVVDLPRLLWWPLLHGVVLRRRPRRSAALYRRIWTSEGSPLLVHTRGQAEGLRQRLQERLRAEVPVAFGMRYGRPGLAEALETLRAAGCHHLLLVPLYPQYGSATTASVMDAVLPAARRGYDLPALRVVRSFATHPGYLRALAMRVREALDAASSPPERILISFHGEPLSYVRRGDPYPEECGATARGLAAGLDLDAGSWGLVYQSRFGRAAWTGPPLAETAGGLASAGMRSLAVVTPGFVSDCLETLDEVGREVRDHFLAQGGSTFTRVPCLNTHPAWLDALADIVQENLCGWEP